MTTTEDVLLSLNNVRYKKGDGTLYVMKERIAWIAENRDTVTVSHHFSDIKTQKISSEGKPKVQLQVVLHDGNSSTFHFVDERGLQAQLDARNQVKDMLHELLPNFKRVVDKKMEEKSRLLKENPKLTDLYRELVISQIISSKDFWAKYAKDYATEKKKVNTAHAVTSGFLGEIKPVTGTCNGLNYDLTPDLIQSIFKTYPAVKRKHIENVPDKMNEEEFWKKFFQSHYFHRDRLTQGTKDMFADCGKIDDEVLKADVEKVAGDPLFDLKEFVDLPLEEGYGGVVNEPSAVNSGNLVHQSMIKRFNQHSIMVLKTVSNVNSEDNRANGPTNSNPTVSSELKTTTVEPNTNKKERIMEKVQYQDLGDLVNTGVESMDTDELSLNIAFNEIHDRRISGMAAHINNMDNLNSFRNVEEVHMNLMKSSEKWYNDEIPIKATNATAAVNALGELSPGGALMRQLNEDSVAVNCTPELLKNVRNLYIAATELIKHFWHNHPILTTENQMRIEEIYADIQRFKEIKLIPFENRAMRELSSLDSPLTKHIRRSLLVVENLYREQQQSKKHK